MSRFSRFGNRKQKLQSGTKRQMLSGTLARQDEHDYLRSLAEPVSPLGKLNREDRRKALRALRKNGSADPEGALRRLEDGQ